MPGWRGGYAGLRDVNSSESVQTQAADLPASGTRDNDSAALTYYAATLPRMLERAGIRVKDAYRPAEVCKVLGISGGSLIGLFRLWERSAPQARDLDGLECFYVGKRPWVRHREFVAWLARNSGSAGTRWMRTMRVRK